MFRSPLSGFAADFARLDDTDHASAGGPLRLTLNGEIDLQAVPAIQDAVDRIIALPPCAITVDLSAVTFLSSTGLGFLAELHTHAADGGHQVTLLNPGSAARRALDLCGFDQVMTIASERPASGSAVPGEAGPGEAVPAPRC